MRKHPIQGPFGRGSAPHSTGWLLAAVGLTVGLGIVVMRAGTGPVQALAARVTPGMQRWLFVIVGAAAGIEIARWVTAWLMRQPAAARARAGRPAARAADAGTPALDSETRQNLMNLLGDVGLAILLTDRAGVIRQANAAAAALLERDGRQPDAVLDAHGRFFGLPVEDPSHLAPLRQFFGREDDVAEGELTLAGSRRRVHWTGHVLRGSEGLGTGRLFALRDVTDERRFESLKGDFLNTVSHELRTPLTALLGSLQLVLARASGLSETDRGLVEIGVKNTERLVRLINDMLDIDRLEQGTIAFHFEPLDPASIVQAAVTAATDGFAERDVTVEVDVPAGLPTVHGDAARLRQVMTNLLDNARKFAPAGSTVRVRATAHPDGVQIDVCDRGPGIPPAEQPLVFRRFWQADRTGADSGAGLGLAICRAIVERHQGRIWIESDAEGGTTASFFLPRSLFRADADAVVPPPAPAPSGARILLVEDDADARAVMKGALEQAGYQVVEAPSGGLAVRLARRERPDVVLLDLVLPDISGYDVLRILKNSPDTAAMPVVVLSIEPERDLARRLGAFEALQKPIDFEAVRFCLIAALRSVGRGDGRLVLAVGPTLSRDVVVLASSLEAEAHEVYRARDLDDLKAWSASHYPDMLVLDSDFIGQTCAEAAEALQAIAAGRHIPLVFLGSSAPQAAPEARWVELAKPICKDDVLGVAETLRGAGRT